MAMDIPRYKDNTPPMPLISDDPWKYSRQLRHLELMIKTPTVYRIFEDINSSLRLSKYTFTWTKLFEILGPSVEESSNPYFCLATGCNKT